MHSFHRTELRCLCPLMLCHQHRRRQIFLGRVEDSEAHQTCPYSLSYLLLRKCHQDTKVTWDAVKASWDG